LTAHSNLGASSAKRWSNCAGSNNFIATVPEHLLDNSSEFASEGTSAHEQAERCLLNGMDSSDENIQLYVSAIREMRTPGTELLVEARVKINEEMYGTADAVLSNYLDGHLAIVDLKYGAGVPVEVEDNPQLLYYLLGARKLLGDHFSTYSVTVIQPRCHHPEGPVRTWAVSQERLDEFESEILSAAEATKSPDATLNAGKHCHFCQATAVCPALRQSVIGGMSDPVIGNALKAAENLSIYKASLERVIYKSLINNQPVDGYKLVAGRSSRKWKDVKGLEEVLKDTPEAWTPPELKSVAQLEKVKSMKAIVQEHSFKQPGGMTLALESDKRPAANRAASDFDDVEID